MSIVIDPNKGLTIPVLTTTQKNAIVSPNTGAMLYDSSLGRVEVYNTIELTYKIQIKAMAGTVGLSTNNMPSTLILMEIAG